MENTNQNQRNWKEKFESCRYGTEKTLPSIAEPLLYAECKKSKKRMLFSKKEILHPDKSITSTFKCNFNPEEDCLPCQKYKSKEEIKEIPF